MLCPSVGSLQRQAQYPVHHNTLHWKAEDSIILFRFCEIYLKGYMVLCFVEEKLSNLDIYTCKHCPLSDIFARFAKNKKWPKYT